MQPARQHAVIDEAGDVRTISLLLSLLLGTVRVPAAVVAGFGFGFGFGFDRWASALC